MLFLIPVPDTTCVAFSCGAIPAASRLWAKYPSKVRGSPLLKSAHELSLRSRYCDADLHTKVDTRQAHHLAKVRHVIIWCPRLGIPTPAHPIVCVLLWLQVISMLIQRQGDLCWMWVCNYKGRYLPCSCSSRSGAINLGKWARPVSIPYFL